MKNQGLESFPYSKWLRWTVENSRSTVLEAGQPYVMQVVVLSLIFFLSVSSTTKSLPNPENATAGVDISVRERTDPPVWTLTRRTIFHCDTDWMRHIEAQAWADAEALARNANQWWSERKWMDAMWFWMGNNAEEVDYKYKILERLENEYKVHQKNKLWPEANIKVQCGDAYPFGGMEAGKICRKEVNGTIIRPFASTWVETGAVYNDYMIVLCPRFFAEKDSLAHTLAQMDQDIIKKHNASAYKFTWAHTYYHELSHLDYLVSNPPTTDYAYGACLNFQLAREKGCTDGPWEPTRVPPNASTLLNGDSYAFFADAAYYQNAFSLIMPGTPIQEDCDHQRQRDDITEGHWLGKRVRIRDTFAKEPSYDPSNLPAPDAPKPDLPYNAAAAARTTGIATPYTDAVAYFSSLAASLSSNPQPQTSIEPFTQVLEQ